MLKRSDGAGGARSQMRRQAELDKPVRQGATWANEKSRPGVKTALENSRYLLDVS
jgi:hypothetical protein